MFHHPLFFQKVKNPGIPVDPVYELVIPFFYAVPDVVNLFIHFLNPSAIGLCLHCKIHCFVNSFRQAVADNRRNCGMLLLDINSPDVIQ